MVVQPMPLDDRRRSPAARSGRTPGSGCGATARRWRAWSCWSLLALVGIFGPLVWPHPYDRVYPQFVRVPASLEAYPRADTILPGFERELARTRLEHDAPELDGGEISVRACARDEAIDPRVLRYFDRSDLFANPQRRPRRRTS